MMVNVLCDNVQCNENVQYLPLEEDCCADEVAVFPVTSNSKSVYCM